MKNSINKACLYFILLISCSTYAQNNELKFRHFTTEAGLSNSECRMIIQDKEGFIWIGTADGLNLYDGIKFKVYRKIINDSTSLQDNSISALYIDYQDVLWIGTARGGLSRYNKEKDIFTTYKTKADDSSSIDDNAIAGIVEDSNKRLWIATFRGLNLYNRRKNNFIRFPENLITIEEKRLQSLYNSKLPREIYKKLSLKINQTIPLRKLLEYLGKSIHNDTLSKYTEIIKSINDRVNGGIELKTLNRDAVGNILIGYSGSMISIFNPDTRLFQYYPITIQNNKNAPRFDVRTIYPDENKLWVGTYGDGIWIFNTMDHIWQKFDRFPKSFITKIIKDSKGNFWFSSAEDGLLIYDPKLNTIQQYKHDEFDKYSITENSIIDTYEDKQHNFWVCEKQGAVDLTLKRISFTSFKQSPSVNKGLTYNNVTSVLEDDDNNLWVGFYNGGLDIINRKTFIKRHLHYDRNLATSVGEGTVQCIFKDHESKIWIGTYQGGLQLYDKKHDRFVTYINNPNDSNSISGNDIRKITEDREGNLWIAAQGTGINKFDRRTKTFKHYRVDYLHPDKTICNDWVISLFCDNNDNIWVGTSYGISCIRKDRRFVKSYFQEPGNDKSLSNNIVLSIFQDSRKHMWFGTSEGLNLFDPKTETFRVFTRKDGLPNDNITGIAEDDKGNLWLSTFKGLSKFSLNDYSTTNFDVMNGLETDEFLNPGGYKSDKGEIMFGGRQGLICFFPDNIKLNTNKPTVYFTDFKIFNKSVPVGTSLNSKNFFLEKQITYLKNITLNYNQNDFTFEFTALNYIFPEKNQYSYILEGFDSHWNDIGSKHDVTFTNLPPGKYIFRVKASNNDGIWNDTDSSISIIIKSPWWKTYWAYAFYMLIIFLLLVWFRYSILQREKFRKKLDYERMEAKKLHELDLMKLRFFTNISHEFRTPLTLILAPIEKLMLSAKEEWQQVQYNLIYRHAKRLLRLINQIMDIRKLEAGGLQLEVTQNDIIRFAKDVADSFNFEALERKIDYAFISNENCYPVWFDKDKLDKILYNLIANAFKFTPEEGKITIFIHVNEVGLLNNMPGNVEIIVEDNGIGISQESLSKVFERFYQADTSSKNQGTGLGLALTKELVELHQGKIHVDSNPSTGTRFSVILPLGKDHLENYQISKKDSTYNNDNDLLENTIEKDKPENFVQNRNESNEIVPGQLPLLLIVEDNPDLRRFIKNEFCRQFKVIEAKDGIAGCHMAIERIPDLIISDVMMPGMEGFELCKKLKTDEITCHIPFIMLTALSSEEKIVTGLETGADDYIIKPFSSKVLKARVKNLIESRHLLRKQFSKYSEIPASVKLPTNLDQNFLQRAFQIIEKNMSNEAYDAHQFSTEMGVSRSLMYKKINALTGMTVHELIRNIRLKKAAELLMSKKYNVSETASEVGFNDMSYFIRCFSKQYGVSPSKYLSSKNLEEK